MDTQGSQCYTPNPMQHPYLDTHALNERPPPNSNSVLLHSNTDGVVIQSPLPSLYASYFDASYLDLNLPTPDMLNTLFSAFLIHQDAFAAIHSRNATDSHFAIVGRAIFPLQHGEEPKPSIFYVRLGRKTIHQYVVIPLFHLIHFRGA